MKGKKASAVVVAAVTFALTMTATGADAATRTAPVVKTLAVTAVTSSSATFNGSVNPGGLATTAWFQWQPADGDNSTTRTVGAGTTPVTYSSTITGLKPATSYKYEAAAINSKGTRYGALVTFTTAAVVTPPPAKKIYLTFDDGPTQGYTNEVLADLNAAGAHATFFEMGQSTYTPSGMCPEMVLFTPASSPATCLANAGNNSSANYALMKQIVAAGDVIGTHSWDHPDFTTLNATQTAAEVSEARSLDTAVTGTDSKLFRFPYNSVTQAGLNYLASQGMRSVGADIDPSDWNWQLFTDTDVINEVMVTAFDGAVVQLHDGQDVLGRDGGHPGYLPGLLSQLKAAGYSFGTLNVSGTAGSASQKANGTGGTSSIFPSQKVGSAKNNA